jgi:hypothetical protein
MSNALVGLSGSMGIATKIEGGFICNPLKTRDSPKKGVYDKNILFLAH